MKFTKFTIKNFKGIEHAELNLNQLGSGNIFTLVGLNESGKTAILEAIKNRRGRILIINNLRFQDSGLQTKDHDIEFKHHLFCISSRS